MMAYILKNIIIYTRSTNIALFFCVCFQFLFSQSIGYENSWAVVIGINDYAKEDIPDLNYAVSDAEGIREMLVEYYGFENENIMQVIHVV